MRFLFTYLFSNDLGLPTSTLPIATALLRRGHEVAACNPAPAPAALIDEAGITNISIRQLRPKIYAPSTPDVWNIDHFAALTGLLDERYVRATCRLLNEVIDSYRPDIIVDSWNPCVAIVAKIRRLPLATIIHSYVHPASDGFIAWEPPPATIPTPIEVLNRVLGEHGVPPVRRAAELYTGDVTLVHGVPETDPLPPDARVAYIGAVLWQRSAAELPPEVEAVGAHKPLIWVYTGNPQYGPIPSWADSSVVLQACVSALADEPVQVIVTTGFHPLPRDVGVLPPNFLHFPYLPAVAIASRSTLLIHHGGYNSCQLSLLTGTPSLVIPTFSEREGNARRLARLGAGAFLRPSNGVRGQKQVSDQDLRALVDHILATPTYADNARAAGVLLQAGGGPEKAAELLDEFATARRSLSRQATLH